MDEEKKKQINNAIELMKSICDSTDDCNVKCQLWRICREYIFNMRKLD